MQHLVCMQCGETFSGERELWRCPSCGGPLVWRDLPAFEPAHIAPSAPGLWRYRAFFPLPPDHKLLTLGEGWTPLIASPGWGGKVLFKLEFLLPTGSFKDRGVALVINRLADLGIKEVADDSSGNAGASMAAYAAMAGIKAHICTPAYAPEGKKAQIRNFGADLISVPGPRPEATKAAQHLATDGIFYASHAWVPINLVGQQTAAFEIWEQLGGHAPDWILLPTGQGTLFLGLYEGFKRLQAAGLINRLPRLVAVQASKVAPLVRAFSAGAAQVAAVAPDYTVADGIAITQPVRGRQLIEALRASHGLAVAVSEEEILAARRRLAHYGLFVEPTSAAPVAALLHLREQIDPDAVVVIPLTGNGLKKPEMA